MCRLFGLVANKPVGARFSILEAERSLKEQAKEGHHLSGWGIGWYEDSGEVRVEKEPLPVTISERLPHIVPKACSTLIIAHVRKASRGSEKKENTHPFAHEKWLFAHNGTIRKGVERLKEKLGDWTRHIKGETDSEVLFYWLLKNWDEENPVRGIWRAISELLTAEYEFSALNFLLASGRKLYTFRFHREKPAYYTLYWLERSPMLEAVSRAGLQILVEKAKRGERAILVASERLTEAELWQELKNGQLLWVERETLKWGIEDIVKHGRPSTLGVRLV